MYYSCCASMDNLDLVVRSGYDRIALQGSQVAQWEEETFTEACRRIEESGICCRSLNAFCPAEVKLVGEGWDGEKLAAYSRRLADRAARLHVTEVGLGSPNSRRLAPDFDRALAMKQWEASLTIIGDIFGEKNIRVMVEPLCTLECEWMNTTDEVLAVLKRLNHPNLGITFDIYHSFAMGEDEEPLRRALPYVGLLHISQYIQGKKHYLRKERMDDYGKYFRVLLEGGYDGEFAIEATYDELETALPRTLEIMKLYTGLT